MSLVINWLLTILFIAALIIIGVYSYKISKKTLYDYAIAGGSLGWVAVACTAFATSASTFTLLGLIGSIKNIGFPYLMTVWTLPAHYLVVMVMIGTLLVAARELHGVYSPANYIYLRYESKSLGVFLALYWYFASSLYVAMQFVACGTVLSPLLDIPYEYAAVFLAIVTLVYIVLGGLRAVAWVNIIYTIIMVLGYLIPVVGISMKLPLSELAAKVNPVLWSSSGSVGYTPELLLTTVLVNLFLVMGWPWMYYSVMGSKSIKVVKISWPFTILMQQTLFFVVAGFIGLVLAPSLFPQLTGSAADRVVFEMCKLYLPGWEIGYTFAIIAAGLSTVATIIILQGVLLESDVVRALGKTLSDRGRIWCSRLASVVAVFIGFFFALVLRIPVGLIWSAVINPIFGLTTPILIGLRWKRATKAGAWASIITGIVLTIIGRFIEYPIFYPRPTTLIIPISTLVAFPICALVFVVVSLLTRPPSQEALDKYLEQPKRWLQEVASKVQEAVPKEPTTKGQ